VADNLDAVDVDGSKVHADGDGYYGDGYYGVMKDCDDDKSVCDGDVPNLKDNLLLTYEDSPEKKNN